MSGSSTCTAASATSARDAAAKTPPARRYVIRIVPSSPPIGGMVHAVARRHVEDVVRIHAFETTDIEAVLVRVDAPLVVRVDPAVSAEVVTRRVRVELVEPQRVGSFDHAQPGQRNGGDDRALAPAHRAVAAARID